LRENDALIVKKSVEAYARLFKMPTCRTRASKKNVIKDRAIQARGGERILQPSGAFPGQRAA